MPDSIHFSVTELFRDVHTTAGQKTITDHRSKDAHVHPVKQDYKTTAGWDLTSCTYNTSWEKYVSIIVANKMDL